MNALAKLIKSNGIVESVKPRNGKTFSYDELSKFFGGYIELIYPRGKADSILVLNEDGKIIGLPINPLATEILKESGGMPGDVIVGDCLLCHSSQIE